MILSFDVGRKNLAVCLLAPGECSKGSLDVVREWAVLNAEPTASGIAAALDSNDIGTWLDECTDVVIERQPMKNPTMTRLQHYIEMWCCIRGGGARNVYVQDAKHKLAFAAATPYWPTRDIASWTYYQRKKLSVETVQAFLAATPDLAHRCVEQFGVSKKKDDYADCLLQAMAFAHHVRPGMNTGGGGGGGGGGGPGGTKKKKVVARKPTEGQLKRGALTKSGVKYLLRGCLRKGPDAVRAAAAKNPVLDKAVGKLFDSVEDCIEQLT